MGSGHRVPRSLSAIDLRIGDDDDVQQLFEVDHMPDLTSTSLDFVRFRTHSSETPSKVDRRRSVGRGYYDSDSGSDGNEFSADKDSSVLRAPAPVRIPAARHRRYAANGGGMRKAALGRSLRSDSDLVALS